MSILDSFSLDGKVAIVTGASSGLGVAFAKGLAEAGADVAICARRVEKLESTRKAIEEMGHRVIAVTADVSKPEDCERVVEETVANLGGVDILINNAGVASAAPATREDPEEFRKVVDINLNGSYFMAQSAGRAMGQRGGGSIVNIGSVLGSTTAHLPQAAYCSSKAAIIGLTRQLARELAPRNIRINAVAPGPTNTPAMQGIPDEWIKSMEARPAFAVATGAKASALAGAA